MSATNPKSSRHELWAFFDREHRLTLTESELDEIMREVGKQIAIEAAESPKIQRDGEIVHGANCPKVSHEGRIGMLHGPDDNTPYAVDGLMYCGRCHHYLYRQ